MLGYFLIKTIAWIHDIAWLKILLYLEEKWHMAWLFKLLISLGVIYPYVA